MTVAEFWKKLTGRTVTEHADAIRRWEETDKPAHERSIRKALIGREGW